MFQEEKGEENFGRRDNDSSKQEQPKNRATEENTASQEKKPMHKFGKKFRCGSVSRKKVH